MTPLVRNWLSTICARACSNSAIQKSRSMLDHMTDVNIPHPARLASRVDGPRQFGRRMGGMCRVVEDCGRASTARCGLGWETGGAAFVAAATAPPWAFLAHSKSPHELWREGVKAA